MTHSPRAALAEFSPAKLASAPQLGPKRATRWLILLAASVVKLAALAWLVLSAGCASAPPTPEWQIDASDSLRRVQAYTLQGKQTSAGQSMADAEARRLREFVSAAADPALRARTELAICAAQAATLALEGNACPAMQAWASSADAANIAYARYLQGQASGAEIELLPEPHRAAARAIAAGSLPLAVAQGMADPLARLIAISAAFQAKAAGPDVIGIAASTASQQGFRRASVAWLGVQRRLAQAAGDAQALATLDLRIQAATQIKP